LYQLKDPPTPPVEIKLAESANHIVLTPDGKTAIISQRGLGAERRVTFMELPSGKVLKSIPMPELSVNSVILTPTAKSVLLGGDDDRFNVAPLDRVYIRTIALDSGKIIGAIRGPARGVDHLAISPDGTTLACAESNFTGPRGVIRVINLKNGANLFYKEGVHTNTTHGLGLTPDKKYVVSTGTDSNTGVCKVVVSDIAARKEKHVFKGFPGIAEGMAVSSDGKLVAAAINGGNGGSVRVWDIETGAEVLALLATAGNRGASRVAFGPDNKSIIATFYDASTRAFDLLTGNEEGGFRGHGIIPNVMVAAPNGKTVVTAYFRDMKVWQFPDSLRRLGKPDDPPAFAIVRDGKKIDVRPPTSAVKDDKLFKIFVNAVVDAIVDDKSSLAVTVDGTPEKLWLHPAAKFFDADGKPVLAADAGRIYRLGNIVTIKTKKEFKTPIAEVRLVREGPKEISVANARLKATRYPGGIFLATPTRELNVSFGPEVRYVDHEGKETTKETGKFFNEEDQYAVKLRLEVGQDFPLLIEARLTPDKGELPVFLKYPLGMIGAKAIKNATIKRVTEGNVSYLVLDIPGANHVSLFTGNESKGYDVKGDELTRQQLGLLEGLRSDVVIVARGKSNLLLEARALVPFPKAEPPPRKFAELKNVEVARLKNSQQSFLKINGKNVLLRLDANVKALDKEGKDIAADRVLQNGNRVDAKVEEVGPNRILHEVRLVEGTTIPERAKTYENAQVTKIGSNKIYTLKAGDTGILAGVSKATRCLDAAGNPADLDQVLRVGNHVDIIVQTGPSAIGNLIEVRAAKKK
jgi:hypothetical protein